MVNDKEQISSLQRRGLALLRSNHLEEAKTVFARLCELSPEDADAWYSLGNIYGTLGNIDEVGTCCRKVIALQPDHREAHANLGNVLFYQGRLDEAIDHYRSALRINPDNAAAHSNLGNALKTAGRLAEAIESYKRAIAVNPNYVIGYYNLGIALQQAGNLEEAGDCFRHAVALKPNYAEAYNNLGTVLKRQDRLEEAKDALQLALAIKPNYAEALYNLANIYLALGQTQTAVELFRQAILIKPDYANAYNNLGSALEKQDRIELAIENFKHALTLNPDHADAYNNLGIIYAHQGRIADAEEMVQHALRIQPNFSNAYRTLGNIRNRQARPGDASDMYQKAFEFATHHGDAIAAYGNVLMTMHYLPRYSMEDLLTAAKGWNSLLRHQISLLPPPTNTPDPCRRLRVGYVSRDFCDIPIGYFVEAALAHHDKALYQIYCYYNNDTHDDITARIKKSADHWRAIKGQSDQAVADLIRQDGIDILVDLSGHTRDNRLLAFSRRPAPIQVTWVGYFGTTGLATMDYILADRYVIPEEDERYYTEQVKRLPNSYLCFTPPNLTISVAPLPAISKGVVTFGCFNNPTKITEDVIACWSRLLHALPNAQLYLKFPNYDEDGVQQRFHMQFAHHGVEIARIKIFGSSPRIDLLAKYHEVDIALDPYPWNGGTTTLEALWMGIPVVSLRGDRFISRTGETILTNVGLSECVTNSEEAYIAQAIALATDLTRLAELRSQLRQQLLNSPLCDAPGFSRDLEAAYRQMWETWCQSMP